MKIIVTFLFVYSIQLYCQTYLNVKFTDDSYKYAELSNISSITFNGEGTEMTVTLTDASSSTETISSISEMTCDAFILGGGSPFPVEMTTFYANVVENVVTLIWETATEVSNYGFEIERKVGGRRNWEIIGFVLGHGNSNSPKEYSFIDDLSVETEELLSGIIHYRLKQIDTGGAFEYTEMVTIDLETPKIFELKQNYPNPFNPATKIVYAIPQDGHVSIKVYDTLGKDVATLANEEKKAGRYIVIFDGSQTASGIYFTKINSGNYTALIKMLLIK
jgi:hypothetical protein